MKVTVIEDQIDLERLEGVIHKNLQAFYAVGRALMDIRDKELYLIKNGGEYQTMEVLEVPHEFRRSNSSS